MATLKNNGRKFVVQYSHIKEEKLNLKTNGQADLIRTTKIVRELIGRMR